MILKRFDLVRKYRNAPHVQVVKRVMSYREWYYKHYPNWAFDDHEGWGYVVELFGEGPRPDGAPTAYWGSLLFFEKSGVVE